jgi:hypothetical protein
MFYFKYILYAEKPFLKTHIFIISIDPCEHIKKFRQGTKADISAQL